MYSQDAGVSPLFPPLAANKEEAQADLNAVVAADPAQYEISRTRWRLKDLLSVFQKKGYLLSTPGSVHQFLARLGIRLVRARYAHRSPDPHYQAKLEYIEKVTQRVKASAGREVLLFLDEVNYYRQPLLAACWTRSDQPQEKVHRSYRSDTRTRILGAIDRKDGRVIVHQATRITVPTITNFYKRLHEAYPEATRIWIVQDNNPVHFHPNLLVALEKQESPFPMKLAPNWPEKPDEKAIKRYKDWNLPIQLVQTPSYAPWCNNIEKLWKFFRQEFLHVHRFCDDLEVLRAETLHFFERFSQGSAQLLQYVGLGVPY